MGERLLKTAVLSATLGIAPVSYTHLLLRYLDNTRAACPPAGTRKIHTDGWRARC